jgi:hypothetical protein
MTNGTLVALIDHASTAIVYVGMGVGAVVLIAMGKDATALLTFIGGAGFKQGTSAIASSIRNGKILNGNGSTGS